MPILLLGSPERRTELVRRVLTIFTPNEVVSPRSAWFIAVAWVTVWLGYWTLFKPDIFPSPLDILNAFPALWTEDGLGQELITSFTTNIEALLLAMAVSLPLAYLSRVPFNRPLALSVAKLRFVSPAVFFLVLLFVAHTGHGVKVYMLALGETVFLTTTMNGVVAAIPEYQFDDARTLRMSEWQTVWYVNVRGTVHQTIGAIRDNAAMGWSMLTMVEGIVRSEGGVGVMILNQEKHVNFAEVYAIALVIVLTGIAQDYAIGALDRAVCPYSEVA